MTEGDDGLSRRKALECMTWAGTGVLWTVAGGVPTSLGIIDEAMAAPQKGFTFLQISDSHVGFDKPANPNAKGTLEEVIARVQALPVRPSFMIHTGDISHLSKPSEFDDAERIISQARLDVHYVPGEHDLLDDEQGKLYRDRYGRGSKGAGWYSFDTDGVHFIGLVNVIDLKAGGLGNLGNEQLEWLENDVIDRPASQPIVVFAHIPLWTVYPDCGWGTQVRTSARLPQKIWLSHCPQRPHPSSDAEGGGQCHVPHCALDRVPAAGARHRAFAGADESAGRQAAHHARHRQRHVQAERAAPRRHRYAAARLSANMFKSTSLMNVVVAGITAFLLLAVVPARAETAAVKIGNLTFGPQELKVKSGTTVVWVNEDDIPHTIVSPNNFRSKTLDSDDKFSFTFTTPGTYKYFCSLHPHMTGTIFVEAATGSIVPP